MDKGEGSDVKCFKNKHFAYISNMPQGCQEFGRENVIILEK